MSDFLQCCIGVAIVILSGGKGIAMIVGALVGAPFQGSAAKDYPQDA